MVTDGPGRPSALTYNGELYNYLDLKRDLEREGVQFTTRSDTEVMLAALRLWGMGAVRHFDAMFAFGFYDAARRELLLGRDIFGEKPLYFVDRPDYFAFASELHALTRLPGLDHVVTLDAIASFLSFQYVPAPGTIYKDIRKLPPGHVLRLGDDGLYATSPYFTFKTSNKRVSGRSLDDLADELEAVLITAVDRRLISDVPLGAFLSGGVDSSTVVAVVRKKLGLPLRTFSIGWSDRADSEHFDAAEIARHLGTDHREQVLQGYPPDLGRHIASVLDEPNGDSSCVPTFLVSRLARETVTVALSGDGGDELFGGYGRYFNTVDEDDRKRAGDRDLDWWSAGEIYISSRMLVFADDSLKELVGFMPPGLTSRLESMRSTINGESRPLINVLREVDAQTYLPGAVLAKVDRMSMQHSLEVRAPLLSLDMAKFAMGLAGEDCYTAGHSKRVLKCLASRYLPAEWMHRPKRGFGLPTDLWSKEKLLPPLTALLLSEDGRLAEWIDRKRLVAYIEKLGNEFHAYHAWSLFILENWLRTHPAVAG